MDGKQLEDLHHQMDNFVYAASTIHTLKKEYRDRPQDLFFALYGRRENVRIVPTTFTIAFELPFSAYRKVAGSSSGQSAMPYAYPESFRPETHQAMRTERIRMSRLFQAPVSTGYLTRLTTIQNRLQRWLGDPRKTAEHEERHIVSALHDAHEAYGGGLYSDMDKRAYARGPSRPYAQTPRYEEAWAYWGKAPAWFIGMNLPLSYGIPDLKRPKAWIEAPVQMARLMRIRALQMRHGRSDEFIAHLLRTENLQDVIDAIHHATGRNGSPGRPQ